MKCKLGLERCPDDILRCFPKIEQSFGVVIFGASGDLTKRKLIPALNRLFEAGILPDRFLFSVRHERIWMMKNSDPDSKLILTF